MQKTELLLNRIREAVKGGFGKADRDVLVNIYRDIFFEEVCNCANSKDICYRKLMDYLRENTPKIITENSLPS